MLWTVARFPSGDWTTGGTPDDPDYAVCEVWQVEAESREAATRKAQKIRDREQRALRSYQMDSGCDGEGCACCAAFLAGMRGQPAPATRDPDVRDAWKAGARRKPKAQPST